MPRVDSLQFWILFAIAALGALVVFVAAFIWLRRARMIEDTPTSKIRSAAQGYVELEGIAVCMDGMPIIAPLTGRSCAWYRYRIEAYSAQQHRNDDVSRWTTVESGVSDALFMVKDPTGVCVIDPEGAKVTPSTRQQWFGETRQPPPFAARRLSNGRYRYSEQRIETGDSLYVLGNFRSIGGAEPDGRGIAVRELLAKWKRDQPRLLERFDANDDGKLDAEEWAQARRLAAREAAAAYHAALAEPSTPLLSQPISSQQPFLISTTPQRPLARRYKLYAGLCFLSFFVLGGGAVWLLGQR